MRSEEAVDGSVGRRGLKFSTGRDQQRAGIKTVVELPGAADRLMMFGKLVWVVPGGFCKDFEVAERAAPGFNGVCRNAGVPVQLVHREIAVFDARQDGR